MAYSVTGGSTAAPSLLVPNAKQIATSTNYVSTLNLHQRDVDEQVYARYGAQGITGLLEMMGAKKECTNGTFEHFEEALLHDEVVVSNSPNLSSAKTGTVIVSGLPADLPVRAGSILRNAAGLTVYVSSVSKTSGANTSDVVIHNYKDANMVNFNTAAAKTFAIIGNEFSENTGQPDPLSPQVTRYTNSTMIIKESFQVSGSEASNVSYVKVDSPEFGSGYMWYLKGEADTYKRFLDYAEMQMVFGQAYGNAQPTGGSLKGTEGLLDFISNKGHVHTHGGGTDISMANFDETIKLLDKFRGSKENALMCGVGLSLDFDDAVGATMGTSASFGTFNNDKDMAVNMGYASFQRGGYTFHKKTYDLFNHPSLGTALSLDNDGLIIPMDTQRDAKGGDMIPSLRVRYKAVPGYSREMEHWLTGSAVLANKTNDVDNLQCNYRTERGFEGFGANRFVRLQKV